MILFSLEGKQLSITRSSILEKKPEWLNSFPYYSKQKAFHLLSLPEQQHCIIPSAGLALDVGKVVPLPCPLPPSWWPWQHLQSFLAKSFSRNPSLSLALALGQEKRQKDILRECIKYHQLPALFSCSPAIALVPRNPTLPFRAILCDLGLETQNSLELFERSDTSSFLTAGI